jgi:hypothetical protein
MITFTPWPLYLLKKEPLVSQWIGERVGPSAGLRIFKG